MNEGSLKIDWSRGGICDGCYPGERGTMILKKSKVVMGDDAIDANGSGSEDYAEA